MFGARGKPEQREVAAAAWIARCVGRADRVPFRQAEMTRLASFVTEERLRRGQTLFEKGKESPGVWILQSGLIELVVGRPDHQSVVQLLRPGDVEGDVFLATDQPTRYSARALTDTVLLYFTSDAWRKLLEEHPAIGLRWLSYCAQRVASSQTRLLELLTLSLAQKVARLLHDEAVDGEIRLPQRTLAAMLAVGRPTLNRILKRFERRGMIRVEYSKVTIHDAEALRRAASAD